MLKKYYPVALIIGLLLSAFSGWRMWSLYNNRELWGHLPLFLFVGMFILLVGIAFLRKRKVNAHRRWLALSVISAACLSLGFPPFPTTFTVLVGFVPLFFIEREVMTDDRIKNPFGTLVFYGYISFVLWNILTTYWVANTALVAGVVAILANSLLMLIPWMTFIVFRYFVGDRTAYFTFIAFWISFEYLHMQWEVTWPWLTLGNALAEYAWLPQWYSYTGVFGGSLWILMTNVFLFEMIRRKSTGVLSTRRQLGLGLWVLVPVVISIVMYVNYQPKGEEAEVVIVQPNFEPHYEKFVVSSQDLIDRLVSLTEDKVSSSTKYLLYPETVFDGVNVERIDNGYELTAVADVLKKYPSLFWVSGISAHRIFEKYLPNRPNLRETVRGDQTIYWEAYNAAFQSTSNLQDKQVYFKSKLVPGPEILPYKDYLSFLKPLIEKLDGTVAGLGTQPDRAVFVSDRFAVAPVICYESIFGEYCNGYVNNGAQALFIMTNDGWWDNTPGHIQHLKFGRLRAIESRRAIARSANTGISCFIDQKGRIQQPTAYNEAIAIKGNILMNDEKTFYVKWGDAIGRLSLFVAFFQLLYIVFGILKKKMKIL